MITDTVFGLLTDLVGFVSGVLPRVPMGPFAPGSELWPKLGEIATQMGWVANLVPWSTVGYVAAFYMSCAGVALAVHLLRFVLRLLRFYV